MRRVMLLWDITKWTRVRKTKSHWNKYADYDFLFSDETAVRIES